MNELIERLKKDAPILTDGAWGSLFLASGLAPGELGDAWNLTHPERVEAVPSAYVEAGSQTILTNTFSCNRITLKKHGLADRIVELNRAGVEISRRAAAGRALVFASLGPTGRLLVTGEVTREELVDVFDEQAGILAAAGPDALVLETMADLEEAKVAVEACRKTGLPVVACMVYDSGRNRDRTMMGVTPEQAAAGLTEAGADVIGANCGQGIPGYVSICRRLRAVTSLPLWMKPNAGLPELVDGRTVYRISPEEFASYVPALVEAGAMFVGGCCGTTPEFIRAVASKIRAASA
ncbi:MAG: homocysteine S-methyltransferase family protein [Bryobacteraceae bacterium]